jgi:hypothetical protein
VLAVEGFVQILDADLERRSAFNGGVWHASNGSGAVALELKKSQNP